MTATLNPPTRVKISLERWPDLALPSTTVAHRRLAKSIFYAAVKRLPVTVELPDGSLIGKGGPSMTLHRSDAFFTRLGRDGLIGFGESYQAGDWDSADLAGFLTELALELPNLVPTWMQRLRSVYVRRQPDVDVNTETQTRGNIARHYDLSNDMFKTFLDETMTYSSALFADIDADEPLADAQRRKIDRLLDRAGVTEGSRVLEIGTGWGELALRAASRGATVHSVTLSSEQLALAHELVQASPYASSINLELSDYRALQGSYDAIVSVEMIEAVGHEYWPTYFKKIDELLAPGGKVAIQAITMPHERMLKTMHTWTWINKYIFPGGFLPSTEAIDKVTREHTTLRISDRLCLGAHYARTLQAWDDNFAGQHERIAELGFDQVFERMWHFYLAYSKAGFASGYLDVQQITFTRETR